MASRYRQFRARALKAMFKAHAAIYELSDGRIGAWAGLPAVVGEPTFGTSGLREPTEQATEKPALFFRNFLLDLP
jgi:hypothetical protein